MGLSMATQAHGVHQSGYQGPLCSAMIVPPKWTDLTLDLPPAPVLVFLSSLTFPR